MSQRAVVRTAALACILGRSSPTPGADVANNSGNGVEKDNTINNKESTVRRAPTRTSARKRVRITMPSDNHDDDEHADVHTITPEERKSPTVQDIQHEQTASPSKTMSLLPSLADVLGHDRSAALLSSSLSSSPFAKNFNADVVSLPSLHSLPAFRAAAKSSGATATVQVDVEIFKMSPALLAPESTSEAYSPAPKRRDSVAAEEETALMLVTLGGAKKIAVLQSHNNGCNVF